MKRKMTKWKIMAAAAIVVLLIAGVVFGAVREHSSVQSKAKKVVEKIFSCTVQQAGDLDAAMPSVSTAGGEVGAVSADDTKLTDYLSAQDGSLLTTACLNQCMANRTFSRVSALAKEFDTDIAAAQTEITMRPGEKNVCDFSTILVASKDNSTVATVSGKLVMVSEDGVWKANALSVVEMSAA